MVNIFIFLLVTTMLLPIFMTVIGAFWQKHPPKEINSLYGYRTNRSMKSKETWVYAHIYFGRIWRMSGIIIAIVSVAAMFIFKNMFENASIVITISQCVIVCLTIIPTEISLRKNFDKNGRRINRE